MNEKNITKIEKNLFLILSAISIYIILFLMKGFIFSFFHIKNYSFIINFIFQILIISISLCYLFSVKNKKDSKSIFFNILLGILGMTSYFLLSSLQVPILNLFGVNSNSPQPIKTISLILYSIFILIILVIINLKTLKKDIKDIKKNHKNYFYEYVKYWFFAILIMMFSNLIINFLNGGNIAGNEETIRTAFKVSPIYILFASIIFAPISEELVFRRSLKNIISSPIAFIITSGLIFGGLHVVGNIESWIDILYLIPYSVHGITFAYILQKTDNVLVPMGLHFMHNGIMMSLEIILLLLGAM